MPSCPRDTQPNTYFILKGVAFSAPTSPRPAERRRVCSAKIHLRIGYFSGLLTEAAQFEVRHPTETFAEFVAAFRF
jgi:hypothetical protein